MYEYEIKLENGKYNIYYYTDNILESIEFYGYKLDEPLLIVKYGYKLKK